MAAITWMAALDQTQVEVEVFFQLVAPASQSYRRSLRRRRSDSGDVQQETWIFGHREATAYQVYVGSAGSFARDVNFSATLREAVVD